MNHGTKADEVRQTVQRFSGLGTLFYHKDLKITKFDERDNVTVTNLAVAQTLTEN